jgi:hypothetical protein
MFIRDHDDYFCLTGSAHEKELVLNEMSFANEKLKRVVQVKLKMDHGI